MQHGRNHDERRFHNEDETTTRKDARARDGEDTIPPLEPAPAVKQLGGDDLE